jgi:hypothetical protein
MMHTHLAEVLQFCFIARPCRYLIVAALTVLASIGATGCAQTPATPQADKAAAASPWALSTSTMRWNEYACELIARNQVGQFPASRVLAYLNLGINNAIVAAKQQQKAIDGAAAGAAATVLIYMFPKDEQAIATRLSGEMAAIGSNTRAAFAAGVEAGRAAGAAVVALARTDRSDLAWTGPLPEGADKWSSRAQPPRPPLGPRLGEMRPFFLSTGADFRAPPPPTYDSAQFRAEVAKVRAVADSRSNEQLRIAQYWETLSGSFAAGLWNDIARGAISSHGLDEAASARVLALMHMASVDATIACHDSKYVYWVPRPTQADPDIRLAIAVPNHPSYPSNHACISGTVGLVLDAQFPDQNGRYLAMAHQAGDSRVYGGIHYQMDLDQGYVIARKVAARALEIGIPTDRSFAVLGK